MNSHSYEQLGDEHFQMLCQALLVKEYPGLQCYPVGMPDGGRDASASALVFQVKYSREPAKLKDPFEWLRAAVEGERDKVERLATRGATQYILLTNVKGTSHQDVGSIDRVQSYLDKTLPIRSQCWWRDDIDRRLETSFDIKLRYPAVLSGVDMLRLVWENAAYNEDGERRRSALQAYLSHFFREESTVRFKQIELATTQLLDLYIDVPAFLSPSPHKKRMLTPARLAFSRARSLRRASLPRFSGSEPLLPEASNDYIVNSYRRASRISVGCADLLTDPLLIGDVPHVVLEGAPGQGKSTLTQYLAQLQRARTLGRQHYVRRYPKRHQGSPVAIPFRMELRDLATWIKGFDPWSIGTQDLEPHKKVPTLEGAIAAHVERYSGGLTFTVTDLAMILKTTPCLLLLDALDEVADTDDRAFVVGAVCEALARLEGNGIQPQVVVTSRPTAIAGSPTFPLDQFLHLSLAPLEIDLALEYSRKWAKARRLPEHERRALPSTLARKMRAAHIAQLAKNTMQLSILLSLVQRRGDSLPDKRTELYNAYFDIFLDRESEKSSVVRDNRELLFDIHRFLGFHLHAVAEQSKTSGRISHERLKKLLREYLTKESQPHLVIEALLKGMVERFGALISRVEGQYEFEVQPLQEYFAARHLNDTAPPSPPGRERTGTKPDRFDGICGNAYWFNVTRFFAGCFSKGELADLAERVSDLISAGDETLRPLARSLGVALLQDWVFNQSPRASKRVVDAVFDDIGLTWAVTGYLDSERTGSFQTLTLPPGGGAERLSEICWERILEGDVNDRTREICRLLSSNIASTDVASKWFSEVRQRSKEKLRGWFTIGYWLGVAPSLSQEQTIHLVCSFDVSKYPQISSLLVAGRSPWLEDLPEGDRMRIFRSWLDKADRYMLPPHGLSGSSLLMAAAISQPYLWLERLRGSDDHEWNLLRQELRQWIAARHYVSDPITELCQRVSALWDSDFESLSAWSELTYALEEHMGRTWASIEIGIMSGAFRNSAERVRGEIGLLDSVAPWPTRIRVAKRFSGSPEWWKESRRLAASPLDHGAWCAALMTWGRADCILQLAHEMDESLRNLDPGGRQSLLRVVRHAAAYAYPSSRPPSDVRGYQSLSADTLTLLSYRFRSGGGFPPLLLSRLTNSETATVCLGWLASKDAADLPIHEWIDRVRTAHNAGGRLFYYPDIENSRASNVFGTGARRAAVSDAILSEAWNMPSALVAAATRVRLRRDVHHFPVLDTAAADKWFEIDGARE